MRHFLLIVAMGVCVVVACAIELDAAKAAESPPMIAWPTGPCNLAHRMDVAIVDGMFFECQCTRLLLGYDCSWYLVAGVDEPALSRKRVIKHPAKRHVVRIYAHPGVVG